MPARHRLPVPARLGTETGGALLLVLAILAALVWANSPAQSSYEAVWTKAVSVDLAGLVVSTDLRGCVNEGLMTLFFLMVGLEAKRELDLGQLRDRRGLAVPVAAGLSGMVASTALYLAITSGRAGAGGWGVAVSTDTALALAALTLLAGREGDRLRVFLLTVLVVDDVVALAVLTFVYPGPIDVVALTAAGVLLALLLGLRSYGRTRQEDVDGGVALYLVSILVGVGLWLALFESGIDPVISGLCIGLLTSAHLPRQPHLERGSELAHSFRAQPTASLAYSASARLTGAISPNDRLQYRLHPWTSQVIVPLFALANAGIHLDAPALSAAAASPVSWGILLAYVAGKPAGILVAARITARGTPRRGKLPVSWRELTGTASATGIGFTVSLLIAARAFDGPLLDQAKIGILATVLISPAVSAMSLRPMWHRSDVRRLTPAPSARDLSAAVDPARDHVRGVLDAPVTLLAYGGFDSRYRAVAEELMPQLLHRFDGEVRYVYRHLPPTDPVPDAQLAAEAVEAAGAQDAFWPMHDHLAHQPRPSLGDAYRAARSLGLDLDRFFTDLGVHAHANRIADDVRSAGDSDVTSGPAFFINGRRYTGPADGAALARELETEIATSRIAVRSAPARATSES